MILKSGTLNALVFEIQYGDPIVKYISFDQIVFLIVQYIIWNKNNSCI